MRCASQLSGTRKTIGLNRVRRIAAAILLWGAFVVMTSATPVLAQSPTPTPTPTPTASPIPVPTPTSTNYDQSAGSSALNLGSNFLERLGNQASGGVNRVFRTNPGGGGASASPENPRDRTCVEGYGLSVRTVRAGVFVGGKRKTLCAGA